MSMYYDWSKIDGYQCPVKIVVSRRGLGKTFGKLKSLVERFLDKGSRFVYVVETGDMIKELARNSGEKFWSALLEYYGKCDTARKRKYYSLLTQTEVVGDEEDEMSQRTNSLAKLFGGTIKINGETAGYIVDFNSFGELKRNNFVGVDNIFVDEFISEKFDKTTLSYPRRLSSIIQSIARLRNVNVFMAGNSVRPDDPILSRMGFKLNGYGFYKKYDESGLFAVLHFVDPSDYPEFADAHSKSVSGRLASMFGETSEEENRFATDLPADRRLQTMDLKSNGLFLPLVYGDTIVMIRERKNGTYACLPFSTGRAKTLFCQNPREQGFKYGYQVICSKDVFNAVMSMIRSNTMYYYSEVEYNQLKLIIKGGK